MIYYFKYAILKVYLIKTSNDFVLVALEAGFAPHDSGRLPYMYDSCRSTPFWLTRTAFCALLLLSAACLGETWDLENVEEGTEETFELGEVQMAIGSGGSCMFMPGETMRCWGDNSSGELGLCRNDGQWNQVGDAMDEVGMETPQIDLGEPIRSITAGTSAFCAILLSRQLKCWGVNYFGILGSNLGNRGAHAVIGDEAGECGAAMPTVPLPLDVALVDIGRTHTCAALVDHTVRCWGGNNFGVVGLRPVRQRARIGDAPNEMHRPPALDFGGDILDLVVGEGFSCVLLAGGLVKCWGRNSYGQLGLEHPNHIGDNTGEIGPGLPRVNLGGTARAISAGLHHTCALLDTDEVKCWGWNIAGQLGLGIPAWRHAYVGKNPADMGAMLPVVDLGGAATAIAAGSVNTCALLQDGLVKCWGINTNGNLGYEKFTGTWKYIGDSALEMGAGLASIPLGEPVLQLWNNYEQRCVQLESGPIKCWGMNSRAQLGVGAINGDSRIIGDQPGEIGQLATPFPLKFFMRKVRRAPSP